VQWGKEAKSGVQRGGFGTHVVPKKNAAIWGNRGKEKERKDEASNKRGGSDFSGTAKKTGGECQVKKNDKR